MIHMKEIGSALSRRVALARKQRGFDQSQLARLINTKPQVIQSLESGRTLSTKYLIKLASVLQVSPDWLAGEIGTDDKLIEVNYKDSINDQLHLTETGSRIGRVTVRGHVQAGNWQEATEWPPEELYSIPAPILEDYPQDKLYGLVVKGDSMDREYKEGSFLICTSIFDFKRDLKTKDHVIVEREHAGKCEATVKEIEFDQNGKIILWPRSHNPDYQAPFIIKHIQDANIENEIVTRISGVVLFSLQKRF